MASFDFTLPTKVPTEHHVQIECTRERSTQYRGRCSCGWIMYGTKAEVSNRAAVHDLDQYKVGHE